MSYRARIVRGTVGKEGNTAEAKETKKGNKTKFVFS